MFKFLRQFYILLIVSLFLCWYLPVSYNNVYACDDFWYGYNVNTYGLLYNQWHHWLTWEGSYTHTFLGCIPHILDFVKVPFLCNMVALVTLYCSFVLTLITFSKTSKKNSFIISICLVVALFSYTNGNAEIRFWVNGGFTYLMETSFVLFFLSVYHCYKSNKNRLNIFLFVLLAFLIGGTKIHIIVYAIGGMIFRDIIKNKSFSKGMLLPYFLLIIFSLVNVCAPGNFIRLNEEYINSSNYQIDFISSICFRTAKIGKYAICCLSIFPIASIFKFKHLEISNRRLCFLFILPILVFVLESTIMYICFRDPGPRRIYVTAEIFLLITSVYVFERINNLILKMELVKYFVIVVCCIFIVRSNVILIKQVPGSIKYSKASLERDKTVKTTNQKIITLEKLPDSYLLLSYFANELVWIENVYLPYFGKENSTVVLVEK